MKFEIEEKQLQIIINCLAEMPWKNVYQAIDIIQKLKPIKEEKEEKKE